MPRWVGKLSQVGYRGEWLGGTPKRVESCQMSRFFMSVSVPGTAATEIQVPKTPVVSLHPHSLKTTSKKEEARVSRKCHPHSPFAAHLKASLEKARYKYIQLRVRYLCHPSFSF